MTKIGLLGDTHGASHTTVGLLRALARLGATSVYHVGDFGFWPGNTGQGFLSAVQRELEKNEQTLYVTPGNHEDYRQIEKFPVREDGWQQARKRILVAPRGHRWEVDGVSFVSLGGAPSVDRQYRIRQQRIQRFPLWWAEEDITEEDMTRTIEGGYADIMIAHDAPYGVPFIEKKIANNPNGFEAIDLEYAHFGRQKMRTVVEQVRPKMFFHGHYHFPVNDRLYLPNPEEGVDEVRIVGLAADGAYGSLATLDLETLKLSYI